MKVASILIVIAIIAAIGYVIYWVWTKARYKTASTNKALVITGPNLKPDKGLNNVFTDKEGRKIKVVRGGGSYIRRFQHVERIPLNSIKLNIEAVDSPTKAVVPVDAEVVAMIKVSDTLKGVVSYAEQFLGKKEEEIHQEISEVLRAHLRSILSGMTVEEVNQDRPAFNEAVKEVSSKQLEEMGFTIISLELLSLSDENGYIESLGKEKISTVRKEAAIAVAQNEKEQANEEARINLEKETELQSIRQKESDIKLEADLKVIENDKRKAEQEKQRDLALQQIQIENDKKLQESTKAKELELTKQQAAIDQEQANRNLALAETKSNEAKVQKDLEAYKRNKDLEVEANKLTFDGEAKAKAVLAEGNAQADVEERIGKIRAENKRMEAEAVATNAELVLAQQLIEVLPKVAEAVAKPLSQIESVRIYGGAGAGKDNGLNGYSKDIMSTMLQSTDMMKDMVGIDLKQIITNLSTRGNTHTVVLPQQSTPKDLPDLELNNSSNDAEVEDTDSSTSLDIQR